MEGPKLDEIMDAIGMMPAQELSAPKGGSQEMADLETEPIPPPEPVGESLEKRVEEIASVVSALADSIAVAVPATMSNDLIVRARRLENLSNG